jgi:hypothetical protein
MRVLINYLERTIIYIIAVVARMQRSLMRGFYNKPRVRLRCIRATARKFYPRRGALVLGCGRLSNILRFLSKNLPSCCPGVQPSSWKILPQKPWPFSS